MTIGAVEDDWGDPFGLDRWLKSEEAGELQRDLEDRILAFLFSEDPASSNFQQMMAQLAWIGARPEDRPFLQWEMRQLDLNVNEQFVPCGLKLKKNVKKTWRFVKEHKFEILAGTALCATGIGVAAVTGYTLSVAVGGITVAGVGSVLMLEDKEPPRIPHGPPPASKEEIAALNHPISPPLPRLELPSSVKELLVTADGVWADGRFYSNRVLMEHSVIAKQLAPPQEAFIPHPPAGFCETTIEKEQRSSSSHPGPLASIDPPISTPFTIPGKKTHRSHIGWINGINNTFTESKASGAYLQSLADGHPISAVYNCTHTPVIDLAEAALLNYGGCSPITADLLQKEWKLFHEANSDRPNARLLQVCHSQGALHVRNALEEAPLELRDRVIVVAIAPAAVVPRRLCFKSFNYASEKDIVYKFEPPPPRPIESLTLDETIFPTLGEPVDHQSELIILPSDPEAKGIDHEFQSSTYLDALKKKIEDYILRQGEYLLEEKESLK